MDQETPRTNRIGLVVIVVAFVALAQLLYFTYQQRQVTQCQANVNQVFLDTIKQRAGISDADRDSVKQLVFDVSHATKPEDVQKAFDDFNQRDQKLQELRDSFKYPDIKGSC